MKPNRPSFIALVVTCALLCAVPAASAATEAASEAPAKPAQVTSTTEKQPSARERRAEQSEFEREKLDQSAFEQDAASSGGGSSAKAESGSSSSGSIGRMIFGLAVVLGAIYGIHYLLKKWGASRMQGVVGTSGVIDVLATTTLAQGRALHLVRVGDGLVLVGATEQSITRLGDVDASLMSSVAGDRGNAEFQGMLQGAVYGSQPGVPVNLGGAPSGARDGFGKRFLDNLRMSTAR